MKALLAREVSLVDDPINAEPRNEVEKRDSYRKEVYCSEGIRAQIEIEPSPINGKVINLSTNGLGIFCTSYSTENNDFLKSLVTVKIWLSWNFPITTLCRVVHTGQHELGTKTGTLIGLSFITKLIPREFHVKRREARFPVRDHFPPTAICPDPMFFYENLFFRVRDFSSRGLGLVTSARNKSLIPGVSVDLQLGIPTGGNFLVPVRITHSQTVLGNQLIVGAEILDKFSTKERYHTAVAEYLFAATDVSVSRLESASILVGKTDTGLSFQYANSRSDWDKILELRYQAYKSVGKFPDAKSPADMLDRFDSYSRQIICRIHNKIVACARIVFAEGNRERSEHVSMGLDIPEWLFKGGVCEFSRACVAVEYRSSDIFLKLISYLGKIGYESGCRYSLVNGNPNTVPVYLSAGYKRLGVQFEGFGTKDCEVLYLDLKSLVEGKVGTVQGWNQIVYKIVQFSRRRHEGKYASRLQIAFHVVIFPLLTFIRYRKKVQKQKRRHRPD